MLPESLQSALAEIDRLDQSVYVAIAESSTPSLDQALRRLSNTANNSVLWMAVAAGLALAGGRPGRRAAVQGIGAIGVSSAFTNLVAKRLLPRTRPDRQGAAVISERHVQMPASTSFPSGHTASAFAFATAVGNALPVLAIPLHAAAAAVGYSRVHTGVHYPGDVFVGAIIGSVAGGFADNVSRHIRR
jgi:membrane-associated phospholipid phosphatase